MANFLTRLVGAKSAGNYAYVTARVRAKKNQLLTPDQYPKMLARDASEIAKALQEGAYKAEIDELASRYRGAELVERATRLNLGRTYAQIQGFATGELAESIGLYLARYDVQNVKTILRGKFSGASPEEILAETIPAGTLAARLPELSRVENVEALGEALRGSGWGKIVREHAEGRQLTNLVELENALDRQYYASLVESVPKGGRANRAMLTWIKNEIDVVNLQTLFRLRFARVTDWEPYFLEGGNEVSREVAQRIVRGSDEEVLAEVGNLAVKPEVVEAARAALASGTVNPVATALHRELVTDASDFSHRAPLSVLPVIDFILHKKTEADNLRAIAYGKQTGLPNATIEELLIL